MKQIIIKGNKELTGSIKIGGAKNSSVAIIPASILSDEISYIDNVPSISDKDSLIEIMNHLGVKVDIDGESLTVNPKNCENIIIPEQLTNKLRASYYFMGVLLSKYKYVEMSLPGGCAIGERPIDFHLEGFQQLGAKIDRQNSKYIISADELIGANIHLKFASVGATINLMFASVLAKGKTTINNAAKEVEIVNVAEFLISMGAKIKGHGTDLIEIEGVKKLLGGRGSIIPDRIEAGTYVIIGALLGKDFEVRGIIPKHIRSLLNKFDDMGIKYELSDDKIKINKAININPINIKSLVYPGFPTDLGQPMQVLLTQTTGTSYFEETIYENRMGHIKYLNKMNAVIKLNKQVAEINGPTKLIGNTVTAVDLRGGAALVLAGLIAEGETIINDADHILRGYEKIILKLTTLGASIKIKDV